MLLCCYCFFLDSRNHKTETAKVKAESEEATQLIQKLGKLKPQIDPTAWVHPSAVIIGNVTIGPRSSIWPHVTIRGDEGSVRIGSDTNIQDGTTIHMTGGMSNVSVGDRVTVGHNCILHGCIIESDILVGMGSIILDNARVEKGAFMGAATLVTGNKIVPENAYVLGNPMRIVKQAGEREKTWIAYAWKHYAENAIKYKKEETES